MHYHSRGPPSRPKKPRGREKTWPWEVLNPLLHFLSPQAPLRSHFLAMCHLQVVWERDLVTFECPIKRRGSVRAPLRVPFRHVTDERTAIFPMNHTHSHGHALLPPSYSFSCLLPPRLFCLFFTQTHSPPWLKIPHRSDCSLSLEQEVMTV